MKGSAAFLTEDFLLVSELQGKSRSSVFVSYKQVVLFKRHLFWIFSRARVETLWPPTRTSFSTKESPWDSKDYCFYGLKTEKPLFS